MKKARLALLQSALCLLLCLSMLVGTTFAWLTDGTSSGVNLIAAGSLDVVLEYLDENGTWTAVDADTHVLDEDALWEPGHCEVVYLRVSNGGSLALKYSLGVGILAETGSVNAAGEEFKLSDHIRFGVVESTDPVTYAGRDAAIAALPESKLISAGYSSAYSLKEAGEMRYATLVVYMPESVGNAANYATGENPPEIQLGIQLVATQEVHETDSFGDDYDTNATMPGFDFPDNVFGENTSSGVETDGENKLTEELTLQGENTNAIVPAGVQVEAGVEELTLEVTSMSQSLANVTLGENDAMRSLNVHVQGVAANNTQPITITIREAAAKGLNSTSIKLYHVENGQTLEMTSVDTFTAHNQFMYDPVTGDVTLYMATFSEVAVVADTVNAWEGGFDYSWYVTRSADYTIANAEQLAAFGAIVGGMDGQTQDSFTGKTVNLVNNVNLGDAEASNDSDKIFYPIGYYNSTGNYEKISGGSVTSSVNSFEGTFNGQGHSISNFYQNTWEMFGDYNDGYSGTPNHYKDAMGLFGYVLNGKVMNLTVCNFSSDGEFTPTGCIAAYADGNSTFENIAIVGCNPRVYNTGNGGIIGIAGDTSTANDDHITLKNITVDNSNKISALWGSYDVACGGLVGMYRGNVDANGAATGDTISFNNCHVSAIMDVYNDVCGNYQYYAYRYSGMIIGSVRHNTIKDGKTVPNMTGISASGCTVNYGDWNDYYYCEFVKNGHPSYSGPDDYKFSRVPNSEIDTTNGKEHATCIGHNHSEVEDHQAIYLPFHQLFTGYSWGVSSIGLKEYSGIVTDLDITEGDQEESVQKFEGKVTELNNNQEYKLSDIFTFVDKGVELAPEALTVTITNKDETNPVTAVFVLDSANWENSTLTLNGTGEVEITIQDYFFCKPTTISVVVKEREPEVKFASKFEGNFLYRVGNKNTVSLGTLFKAVEGQSIGENVTAMIETVSGNAAGTYTSNADWTQGKIQFTGTGVVKVTITDNDYCTPTVLQLEVVNATNLISATGTTSGGDMVLLCDVNTATYVNYWNCTLYGNGFTYSLKGAPTAYNSKQGHGILITKNATLDNLVIVGDVYNSYGAYSTQDYYNAAVDVVGDTIIQNCYISGCAAPVSTRANATITNTTLYGGTVANLIIKSGTVTLNDVTTANYDDGRSLVGMGIVIHSDATESAKLVLNGTLTQYNFIDESKTPTDSYAKELHKAMFGTGCSQYHFGSQPNRQVNAGIISLTALFNAEDITDNASTGYVGTSVTVSGVNGYVYTQPNTSGSVNNGYNQETDGNVSSTQGTVPPSYSFDYTNKNYQAKQEGSNDYCYEENGKVHISMDEGDTFNWDTSILTVTKAGQTLSYTVEMNGVDYTGKSIAFNAADDYVVTYTYTDENNYGKDGNGNLTTYSKTYTQTVKISVAVVEAATKHAEFTFGSSNTASTTVTVGNNTYVMPNVSATSSTIGSTTVEGKTIYYPIVEIVMSDKKTSHTSAWYAYFPVLSGAVTITDYQDNGLGDAETFGSSTQKMPSGLSIVGDPAQLFKYQSSSTAGTSPVVKNNILVYSSPSISAKRSEYNTVIQYSYQDNAGATYYYYIGYHAPAQSYTSCVTGDTMVMLADGTQKRIDEVTYQDQLLVWGFDKGGYTVANSSIIENHGYDTNQIITLTFEDGTTLKVVNVHGFFDADLNKWVDITANDVQNYIGHSFTQVNGNGYKTVELVAADVTTEYVEAWSILSAGYYNCVLEGMFSITPPATNQLAFFEIGNDMQYDAQKKQADIDKYGLYTYEEVAHLMTEEQFEAFCFAEIKIAVGKGLITFDELLALLASYT